MATCPQCGFENVPLNPYGWYVCSNCEFIWRLSTCPQCGTADVVGTPIPGGTHFICQSCSYEWDVASPPPYTFWWVIPVVVGGGALLWWLIKKSK